MSENEQGIAQGCLLAISSLSGVVSPLVYSPISGMSKTRCMPQLIFQSNLNELSFFLLFSFVPIRQCTIWFPRFLYALHWILLCKNILYMKFSISNCVPSSTVLEQFTYLHDLQLLGFILSLVIKIKPIMSRDSRHQAPSMP